MVSVVAPLAAPAGAAGPHGAFEVRYVAEGEAMMADYMKFGEEMSDAYKDVGDVVAVMDAMGKDVVLVETVGVGQDEIDIVRMAHTTVVVMVPGLGDDIQAIKAGILEIGDIFVVNKADREGADRTVRELANMLDMKPVKSGEWQANVLKTEAQRNRGIEELVEEIDRHRGYLFSSGAINHLLEEKNAQQFIEILKERLFSEVFAHIKVNGRFREIVAGMMTRQQDPYSAVEAILAERMGRDR